MAGEAPPIGPDRRRILLTGRGVEEPSVRRATAWLADGPGMRHLPVQPEGTIVGSKGVWQHRDPPDLRHRDCHCSVYRPRGECPHDG